RTGEIADKQVFSRPCQCRWIAICREWQGCNGRCDTSRQHKPANCSFLDKIKTVTAVKPQPNRTKADKGLILRIEQPFQFLRSDINPSNGDRPRAAKPGGVDVPVSSPNPPRTATRWCDKRQRNRSRFSG